MARVLKMMNMHQMKINQTMQFKPSCKTHEPGKKKSELKKSKANESQLNRSVDHVDVYQTTQIKNQNRDGMGNFVG